MNQDFAHNYDRGDKMIVVKCNCGKKQVLITYNLYQEEFVTFRDYFGKCKCGELIIARDLKLEDIEQVLLLN